MSLESMFDDLLAVFAPVICDELEAKPQYNVSDRRGTVSVEIIWAKKAKTPAAEKVPGLAVPENCPFQDNGSDLMSPVEVDRATQTYPVSSRDTQTELFVTESDEAGIPIDTIPNSSTGPEIVETTDYRCLPTTPLPQKPDTEVQTDPIPPPDNLLSTNKIVMNVRRPKWQHVHKIMTCEGKRVYIAEQDDEPRYHMMIAEISLQLRNGDTCDAFLTAFSYPDNFVPSDLNMTRNSRKFLAWLRNKGNILQPDGRYKTYSLKHDSPAAAQDMGYHSADSLYDALLDTML